MEQVTDSKVITRKEAEEEIADFKRKDGENWHLNFNNFCMMLPTENEEDIQIVHYRNITKLLGDQNTTFAKKTTHVNTSKLKLSQTRNEFFSTIDEAIVEEGLDIVDARRWNKEKTNKELYELVIPVFVNLRARGYSEEDLVT